MVCVLFKSLSLSGIMAGMSSQQPGHFHVCRQSNVTTWWNIFQMFKSKTISMFSTDGEQRVRPKAAPEGGNLLPSHQTHQSLWWHRRGCLWQGETIFLSFLLRQMKANCCSCYSGKLEEAMTMIVLVTRSTSLGWSDNWISQPPWVSDQGWSFRLNGKRQRYHQR